MQKKANPRKDKDNRKKFDPKAFAKKYLKSGHPWDGHKRGVNSEAYQKGWQRIFGNKSNEKKENSKT